MFFWPSGELVYYWRLGQESSKNIFRSISSDYVVKIVHQQLVVAKAGYLPTKIQTKGTFRLWILLNDKQRRELIRWFSVATKCLFLLETLSLLRCGRQHFLNKIKIIKNFYYFQIEIWEVQWDRKMIKIVRTTTTADTDPEHEIKCKSSTDEMVVSWTPSRRAIDSLLDFFLNVWAVHQHRIVPR